MGSQEPRRELEPWAHAACGFIAGTNATAVLYPLELVKARLQSAHFAESFFSWLLRVGFDHASSYNCYR